MPPARAARAAWILCSARRRRMFAAPRMSELHDAIVDGEDSGERDKEAATRKQPAAGMPTERRQSCSALRWAGRPKGSQQRARLCHASRSFSACSEGGGCVGLRKPPCEQTPRMHIPDIVGSLLACALASRPEFFRHMTRRRLPCSARAGGPTLTSAPTSPTPTTATQSQPTLVRVSRSQSGPAKARQS